MVQAEEQILFSADKSLVLETRILPHDFHDLTFVVNLVRLNHMFAQILLKSLSLIRYSRLRCVAWCLNVLPLLLILVQDRHSFEELNELIDEVIYYDSHDFELAWLHEIKISELQDLLR